MKGNKERGSREKNHERKDRGVLGMEGNIKWGKKGKEDGERSKRKKITNRHRMTRKRKKRRNAK